ncbi:hypothetical protein DPV69_07765 [Pedobacter chitinilyticus]|uniref:Collagen-like protein n=1 Tax=Pedobacter chitinilyticus TaxID=2233776 RepID=A0A3S3SSC6_9SPHI|nr:hypothetical protein DPV69_07765 [Pedobacter chitinilyticus]
MLYGPKTAAGWGVPILLRGADGAQGPTGPAGKDGSIMHSGTGAPATTLGVNGDYYLDKNTGNLYGPKTAAGWGGPTALRGSNGTNGTNGTNGSTTHAGLGAPNLSIGVLGDYYLDKTNYLLYGPKDNIGWGAGVLLRGADGAQGPMGPAGTDGTVIYSGETAPDPTLGKAGDFYISRLPVMLYGPKNANLGWGIGTSLKGADGANGTNGTNGNTILNGGGPPQNTQGNNGDYYIDLTTYTMYGPKNGGAWPYPGVSLKGADGNSNVIALETADAATFDWAYETTDVRNLMMRRNGNYNDSTSVYNIPAAHIAAAQTGTVLVYLRINNGAGVVNWKQLNFTDYNIGVSYFYNYSLRIDATTAKVRVISKYNTTSPSLINIDKVRIVVVPPSSTGTLSNINPNTPMLQTMQKLNLSDKDFIKLK